MDDDNEDLDFTDIHELFCYYNSLCFNNALSTVIVTWSKKLKVSAGVCCYKPPGLCIIRLSEPLLKYRNINDYKQTLLHEMIHAYLFLYDKKHKRNGHGKEFIKWMNKINNITGLNVTINHNYVNEVNYYKKYIWRCNGICRLNPPKFGYIRKTINSPPSSRDSWWLNHMIICGGEFIQINKN